jgi:hypothetical protein
MEPPQAQAEIIKYAVNSSDRRSCTPR